MSSVNIPPQKVTAKWLKMLDFYFDTETQLLELSKIIPLENTGKVFSPRLYNILQSACGQIENLMKLLCDYYKLDYGNEPNYPKLFDLLDKEKVISFQRISYYESPNWLEPFSLYGEEKSPSWWKEYNKTKHNLPEGLEYGNLRNVLSSMAGLYALHCIVFCSLVPNVNVLKKEYWMNVSSKKWDMYGKAVTHKEDKRPKSEIFQMDSYFSYTVPTL
ncbi:hypothetical protein [Nitrosopumilus sp.]|uniref:hypothetical protein n=1 Tax=Nitrosopumilus sp. TaxID=2024843 RepID=UPI00292DF3B3|nr:hypothetical protein [Nitrosopumilus sp.]